jgi:TatD DNase family protein
MNYASLVDAQCQFDLFPNPHAVLEEAERSHVYSIAVTNTPSVFEPMKRLAAGFKFVRPALGLHPELAIKGHPNCGSSPSYSRKPNMWVK